MDGRTNAGRFRWIAKWRNCARLKERPPPPWSSGTGENTDPVFGGRSVGVGLEVDGLLWRTKASFLGWKQSLKEFDSGTLEDSIGFWGKNLSPLWVRPLTYIRN